MKRAGNVPIRTQEDVHIQEFLDMIAPSVIRFETDHFICGNTYRCVWALREYPTSTDEQAILSHLGEKDGVTLRIYTREPKTWDDAAGPEDMDAPRTFRIRSRLSQHISFLKDFFRSYKDFTDREIDVIEIMLQKLYAGLGITDQSDFDSMGKKNVDFEGELTEAMGKMYEKYVPQAVREYIESREDAPPAARRPARSQAGGGGI